MQRVYGAAGAVCAGAPSAVSSLAASRICDADVPAQLCLFHVKHV